MKPKYLWYAVILAAVFAILIIFMSQRTVDPKGVSPTPEVEHDHPDAEPETPEEDRHPPAADNDELYTSTNRPLQKRVAATFPDSFKRGVDIFWEPVDGWPSPEVFDWWAAHLEEGDIDGVTLEAAERMFSRISDDSPVFSRPDRRRICAVVGASRNLLGSRYGDLIDAHDIVFRVNRAPTDTFSSDVGERTTHHVMWPRDLEEWQYDREAYLLMTPISANTKNVFDRILYLVDEYLHWDPLRVRIIHPEFVMYLHENWTEGWMAYPSTGFITLMVALSACDEVDVFGFGADAAGRWDRYYEDVPVDVTQFHPANIEAQIMQEMEEGGIIKIFRGNRVAPDSDKDVSIRH
ncbi:MAG: glycosyltransferase family 29 protein [Thermoanaerobaculales bacterium]|nr:glycosyltransferase family 29 protein [Thermoanaerobaculales bacterium]